jgi:hypothetical protein
LLRPLFVRLLGGETVNWHKWAELCAKDAFDNYFPSRRGIWYFEDLDVLVFYDNNPYDNDPLYMRRMDELCQYRHALNEAGLEELGFGTTEDGYSYALVIDAGRDREEWVRETFQNILMNAA